MTERDPDKWVASVSKTLCKVMAMGSTPHFRIARLFNASLDHFFKLNEEIWEVVADGKREPDPACQVNLRKYYVD